jgi:hypothetical protein
MKYIENFSQSDYIYISDPPNKYFYFTLVGLNISPIKQSQNKYAFGRGNDVEFNTELKKNVDLPLNQMYFITRRNCNDVNDDKVYFGDYIQLGCMQDNGEYRFLSCGWDAGVGKCNLKSDAGYCNGNDWQTLQICKDDGKNTQCNHPSDLTKKEPVTFNQRIKFRAGLWNEDNNNALQMKVNGNHFAPAGNGSIYNEFFSLENSYSTKVGLLSKTGESPYTVPSSSKEPDDPSPSDDPGDDPSPSDDPGDDPSPSDDPGDDPSSSKEPDDPSPSDDPGDDPSPSDDPGDDPSPSDDPGDDPSPSDDPGDDPSPSDDPGDSNKKQDDSNSNNLLLIIGIIVLILIVVGGGGFYYYYRNKPLPVK